MGLEITLKDSLISQEVDEEFGDALQILEKAGSKGVNFVVMDDMEGGHVMLNIENILMLKERVG